MASTDSVTDVLRPRLLRIPDYQRGYAWEAEQVQDFLDDLRLLPPGQRHYTGTVVLLADMDGQVVDDDYQSLATADVVDGQQRLTTILLLLNEIRRSLSAAGQTQGAHGLKTAFLLTSKEGVALPKLQVQNDARPVWMALLSDGQVDAPKTISGRRLLNAALQMREHVADIAAQGGVAALQSYLTKIQTQLRFTVYALDSQAEVGIVFETLNDRGKPLTELEKVKNYLHFLAARLEPGPGRDLATRINAAWSDIYHLLLEVAEVSSAGEDQFLRAHWLAAENPVPSQWQGTKSVKARFNRERYVNDTALLIDDVGDYVDSLRRAATAFADSLRPDLQGFSDFGQLAAQARTIHAQLSRARTIAVFQPIMIAMRRAAPDDGRAYIDSVELCLRFAVRTYLIGGYRADTGQGRLYNLAHQVYAGRISPAQLSVGLRKLVTEYASDDFVRQRLLDGETNWYHWTGLRYFLYEYEVSLLKGASPDTEYRYFEKSKREKTVEHILPQTATSEYWTSRFSEAERLRSTNALGNLVLTRDNSSYSNKDFPDKRGASGPTEAQRACYAQAPLRQEQELAIFKDWDPGAVTARQQALAAWAVERWAVSPPDSAVGLVDVALVPEDELDDDGDLTTV